MENQQTEKKGKESALANIGFNIIIPVILLTKLPQWWADEKAPLVTLISALSFPVGYFIFDLVKKKKTNFVSVIGFISVLLTGVIGVMQIPNEWLAIKEAAVPCVIMLVLLISMAMGHPVIELFVYTDALFDKPLIESKLAENGKTDELKPTLNKATLIVALSFLLSTILNYTLASTIVTADPIAEEALRTEQIGKLTFWSYIVIALPCTVIMLFAMWYLMRKFKAMTGLTSDDMLAPELRDKMAEAEEADKKEGKE